MQEMQRKLRLYESTNLLSFSSFPGSFFLDTLGLKVTAGTGVSAASAETSISLGGTFDLGESGLGGFTGGAFGDKSGLGDTGGDNVGLLNSRGFGDSSGLGDSAQGDSDLGGPSGLGGS